MAKYLANEQRFLGNVPPTPPGDEGFGARPRVYRATINLDGLQINSDTTKNVATGLQVGDTVSLGFIPPGMRFVVGRLLANVSLGTSTIAIGNAAAAGKYRAAAVFTAVDVPTNFGTTAAAAAAAPTGNSEEILLTVTTAAMPLAAGNKLVVDLEFMGP